MNVAEIISEKVVHLPISDQQEILELVENIESRRKQGKSMAPVDRKQKHPLTVIAEMAVDMNITDFADRHDFYAHGKMENW